MSPERIIEITPEAPALITSLRGLGYSPETALADLIDNSITAQARSVEIDLQWNDGTPVVAILDDGKGIDETRLAQALKLGGQGPDSPREASDLGRFGMGLKTASLSQCRRMTVITKADATLSAITLDVDTITTRGWIAIVPDPLPTLPFVAELAQRPSGTLIIWDRVDELSGLAGLQKEAFYLRIEEIRAHLGMVFHRFISGDASRLSITLNGRAIKAWDPFQTTHPSTQEMPSERIRHAGASFTVKPYVLPHRDRFENDRDYELAGGPGGWGARQGFYVYRGKRLLVAGSWLGLGGVRTWTRDEASRLARIEVDLPTGLDRDWRIDVRKSQARPPGALRARLTAIAGRSREEAREVFAFRGRGPHHHGARHDVPAVWLAVPSAKGIQYRINRDHPVVVACRAAATGGLRPLNAVLSIIERSVPVERIWLDVSESEGAEVPALDANDIAQLTEQLVELGKALPASMTTDQRIDALLLNLPGDLTQLRTELTRRLGGTHG
ncbi:ATP-binding protein [Mesorhizobium sp. M7A.F.Ca.US.001.02.1.1]|uniref:ATP-binding protein n=1 Tax=Mesorhizobium sp. M7A.F.Ca.US.001.02.1.1 TaxID=2496703 RepID=UPI000FD48E55|nr:ATP-binding protein [Mesorhizobium sp. M7A.F.Ca.US.001.02.1.1]RVA05343.1 ATP-binding protein [Mesorhizobium sp. M7A.F.Ca.US.001.02.1.1]